MEVKYRDAKNIRFSCAYLFRIVIDGKYLLVKDEQGRNTFQPVGGVYKYTDSSFLSETHAVQCTRFGNNSDLDNDLRVIVPRKYVSKFKRWYKSETGRETPQNLYREFQEEILDRIKFADPSVFDTIEYKYCGEHIEKPSRLGERDLQIHIADVVELIPTPQQTKALLSLMEYESTVYTFATKEEIYNFGRTNGNQIQTISSHTYKILLEEEKYLKPNKRTGKYYKCQCCVQPESDFDEAWVNIERADITQPFTFISYNSSQGRAVWDFCSTNSPPLNNLWIDRKRVGENWQADVEEALNSSECKKAILFINREYLNRSTPCYYEASLIVKRNIPHIVILIDIDSKGVSNIIKDWIWCDSADKDKLRVFKELFHYDNDTGHINGTWFSLNESNLQRLFQAFSNLEK